MIDRREFLTGSFGATLLAALPADLLAAVGNPPSESRWDPGRVTHLLPTVSDTALLIKASFVSPLAAPPVLRLTPGATAVRGRPNDTQGRFWQFRAEGLSPGRRYLLALTASDETSLCQPWELSTFPSREARPEHFRVLIFTCAGGHEQLPTGFLSAAVRNRLLRRGLSFGPQAVVANGDHVYWDLLAPRGSVNLGASPEAARLAGKFDRSALVFGENNETVLKLAAGPQIIPVYGTDFRSTPVFFLQDDHDNFDNDEATDEIVTFPPSTFMLRLARATQRLYYPEFLPDADRPRGLPWSEGGADAVSESFGTIRYGRLAEINLYDVRRTGTLAGPSAVFVDPEVESWLRGRAASTDVTHLVHVPSNPPGWSAGKWGEWYPDILGADKKLTTSVPKPYWQSGWLRQHDRLMQSLSTMKQRIPLIISGDLHAVGIGRMLRAGALDFQANPITTVLAGPIGTNPGGWPSAFRGVGPTPPAHLDLREEVKPIEQHGFTIADFHPDRIVLRFFKWDVRTQSPEEIDTLNPFHTTTLGRPS
ncbi:MAG: hypothetical protein EXS32_12880 [Opitutus sp.]|nr:hypothetical protein [Opitutus sp.]